MSALRDQIKEFVEHYDGDTDIPPSVIDGLRDILAQTPDEALFDDGLAHAMPKTALCGAPAHYPIPIRPDCPRCEARLSVMVP